MPLSRTARRAAALAVAAALLVPSAQGAALTGEERRAPDPVSEREALSARSNPLSASQYTGVDGKTHSRSPILIRGRNGSVFFGEEMDGACGYGKMFNKGLARLASLAKVIEKSGRRVIFTVPPNKTAVQKRDILKSQLPHGACDLKGIAQQDRVLDTFRNDDYLPLRKTLEARAAAGQRRLYWPIDTHWTRLGAQVFLEALANRLDPQLAKRQTARKGKETIETDVSFLGVIPETHETGPAVYSTTKVKVAPVKGSPAYDHDLTFSAEHEWTSKPARKAWPGRTVIIGDSFTYRALDNLMPLFAHGHFLWYGQVPVESLIDAIPAADTVVIAMTQRYLPIAPLTQRPFKNKLRQALGG